MSTVVNFLIFISLIIFLVKVLSKVPAKPFGKVIKNNVKVTAFSIFFIVKKLKLGIAKLQEKKEKKQTPILQVEESEGVEVKFPTPNGERIVVKGDGVKFSSTFFNEGGEIKGFMSCESKDLKSAFQESAAYFLK